MSLEYKKFSHKITATPEEIEEVRRKAKAAGSDPDVAEQALHEEKAAAASRIEDDIDFARFSSGKSTKK